MRSQIQGNSAPLALAYGQASDIWATGLGAVNLSALTLIYVNTSFAALSLQPQFL
ncbi:MAG: hypothetical protein HC890_13420, partial [Chloroflexaceae bacterium]|nr:hypothetical protein [Chloroflexaceae bacterium]